MTNIKPLERFVDQELPAFAADKEHPEEWYVLIGQMVTEYSVSQPDIPAEYAEYQEEAPPEERDANPSIEGYYQIGCAGWTEDAFAFGEEDDGFVSEVNWGDKVDRRLLNIIVVHESVLSDEAIAVATGDREVEADA